MAHNLRRAVEIGAEGVVVHTGSYVDATGDATGCTRPRCAGPRGAAAAPRHASTTTQLPWLAARADRGPGPLAVRRRRGPRAVPGTRSTTTPRPGSASTPATRSPPGHRWTSRAGRPGPWTGSSRSPAPAGCGWCTPTTRMDPRGSMRDRHERLGEGHIGTGAFARAARPPGHRRACRSSSRRPAPATRAATRSRWSRGCAHDQPAHRRCSPPARCCGHRAAGAARSS